MTCYFLLVLEVHVLIRDDRRIILAVGVDTPTVLNPGGLSSGALLGAELGTYGPWRLLTKAAMQTQSTLSSWYNRRRP